MMIVVNIFVVFFGIIFTISICLNIYIDIKKIFIQNRIHREVNYDIEFLKDAIKQEEKYSFSVNQKNTLLSVENEELKQKIKSYENIIGNKK